MKKKIIATLLCLTLAFSGTICANAAGKVQPCKGFKLLSQQTTIPDNTVKVYQYGVDSTYSTGIRFIGGDSEKTYEALFRNSISNPQTIKLPATETYARYTYDDHGSGGNIYPSETFKNTGGTYKKVRIKLSEFSDYFNEDGSHTKEVGISTGIYHNFKFRYEDMGDYQYRDSSLVFISGGAATGVVPDENGEVELYIYADVCAVTEYMTEYSYCQKTSSGIMTGGGGGTSGSVINKLVFGNVNLEDRVNVNDVTYLQMYLAGMVDINTLQLFHADSNCDNAIDVADVTNLQFGIAGI